jgi:predicted metalloendopeptidase
MEFDLSKEHKLEDNFYKHVNDNWEKNNPIPADLKSWGSFNILTENTTNILIELLERNPETKPGMLYSMGLKDNNSYLLNNILCEIDECVDSKSLFDKIYEFELLFGVNNPVNYSIEPDYDDSNMNILHIYPGGLGLPDKEYYIDSKHEYIRTMYIEFIKDYSTLFNFNFDANGIYNLEKELASKTMTKIEKRNPKLQNNKRDIETFLLNCSNLSFIRKLVKNNVNINITQPNYFVHLNSIINSIDVNRWKEFFKFRIMVDFHSYLSEDIQQAYFNFYGKVMYGMKEMKSRKKRSLQNVQNLMGELLGDMYRKEYFKNEDRESALILVKYIKDEVKHILENNSWMEKQTKEKALEKLEKMHIKIGYSDKLYKDYDRLILSNDKSYLENILSCRYFNIKYLLKEMNKKVNKEKWEMPSYTVNAYYSPNYNDIVFPAGILQSPFFSSSVDMVYNFGGIGAVIGHEITHGFDDMGCMFDGDGNLKNWWTDKDTQKYKEITQKIKEQYDNIGVNGALTLGENIADIGGIYISLRAYLRYCKENTMEIRLDRFFMNYANIWKSNMSPEAKETQLNMDPHSPPSHRVNMVVKNIDEYYDTFNIKENMHMYMSHDKRANIWKL